MCLEGFPSAFVGALLFFVSDFILLGNPFYGRVIPYQNISVLAFYYSGQIALAFACLNKFS
jgi:uncharacterized membrane protein YhhN